MRKLVRVSVILSLVVVGVLGTGSIALAGDPFLCPVVGGEDNDNAGKVTGVLNADANNGENGVEAIEPDVGTSQLPGNNQAGAHANENALALNGPVEGAGPGHNPDFSPIWK